VNSAGKAVFRVSGFSNSSAISSNRAIAVDSARQRIWAIDFGGHRIRQFDLSGKELQSISGVRCLALAVDLETGNVWATVHKPKFGMNGTSKTVVFDEKGEEIASYEIPGWDIVYDRKGKSFWIAEKKLTRVIAATGKVVFSTEVTTYYVRSLDVDPNTGNAWVAASDYEQKQMLDQNRLLRFNPDGKELTSINTGIKVPIRVSVDPKNGSVWVANAGMSVERFSANGKWEAEYFVEAQSIQVDSAGGDVWVVTSNDVQRMTSKGEVTSRTSHAAQSRQVWIAALE
jgi:DNA-binding beta-propeller fold protein YncE